MLYVVVLGVVDGFLIIFVNLLGIDLWVWDLLLLYLGDGYCIICFDKWGYGLFDCLDVFYLIDDLVFDVIVVVDVFGVMGVVFVGLLIGGLIGQVVVLRWLDLVLLLVLMDIVVKIGEVDMWIVCVLVFRDGGIEGIVEVVLDCWFVFVLCNDFVVFVFWWNMLVCILFEGYIGCCQVIVVVDYCVDVVQIDVLVMVIVGVDDFVIVFDVVWVMVEFYDVVFYVLLDVGYLFCVEQLQVVVCLIIEFLERIYNV